MSDTTPKWRRFEDLVAHIQRTLAPAAIVEQNAKILGVSSGVFRQIDILIRTTVGQFDLLVVVDCKDHKEKIDVKGVEEFIGLVSDVAAHKGALGRSGRIYAGRQDSRDEGGR